MPSKTSSKVTAPGSHPLDGTFAYFDSELEIKVGPVSKIIQHGQEYVGHFTFTGRYSVELSEGKGRYYWPVIGGTLNELIVGGGTPTEPRTNTGYELGFVIFSPNVRPPDPTHGNQDLSRFMDAWAGYAGVDPGGRVNNIQLRFLNVTFIPEDPPQVTAGPAALVQVAHQIVRLRHMGANTRADAAKRASGRGKKSDPLPPIRTAWSAFTWQPTWEDFGARSYIRKAEQVPG